MKLNWFVLLTIGAIVTHAQEVPCKVTAKTESGVVCGTIKKDITGNDFTSFTGIPYAKAPYGNLRFAPPQPREHFDGVFNATTPGPVCPQRPSAIGGTYESTPMDEDCLILNIYVPKDSLPGQGNETKPLPVMFFVPGGSFASGTSSPDIYGPEYLMTKGIILVIIQYRINVFGFLTLESKEIPGNSGMRDVVFALKWVQNNIRHFGGDQSEVTLSGHSAGGVLVSLITLSPAVKGLGLFKRVMAISSTALANTYTTAPQFSRFLTQLFLDGMGLGNVQNKRAIYEELIKSPVKKILEATVYVGNATGLSVTFSPVVETRLEDCVLPTDPEYLMNEGYGREYTTMMGFTNHECNLYYNILERQGFVNKLRRLPFRIVPQNLLITSNVLTIPALTAAVSAKYFNGSQITLDKYIPLCHDANFKYPAMRMTQKRLETGAAPTFIYQFGYHGVNSIVKMMFGVDYPGAGHIEDISYVFRFNGALGPIQSNELAQPDTDSRMKQLMTTFYANFVKTGNPHSEWLPAGPGLDFMYIDDPMKPECGPATPYMADMKHFFDILYLTGRGE